MTAYRLLTRPIHCGNHTLGASMAIPEARNAPSPCQACRVCTLTVLYALVLAQDRVISPGALPYPHEQGDTKLLLSVLNDLGCPSPHNAATSG